VIPPRGFNRGGECAPFMRRVFRIFPRWGQKKEVFMPDEKVGMVIKFFAKPEVAAIELTDGSLSRGDRIRIVGHTTDFEQGVDSIQIDNAPVDHAEKGSSIGIKVGDRVREHDVVYKVTE